MYAPHGVDVCVDMQQVEARVINVLCLEEDCIMNKHYNTVNYIIICIWHQ